MRGIIAKKYVNALMSACDDKELAKVSALISEVAQAFASIKFQNIILSPDVSTNDKQEFVLSLIKDDEKKFVNLIKLLAENDRLALLEEISEVLKYQIALKNNIFEGEVISNFEIDSAQMINLEKNLSKKFGAEVKLNQIVTDYPGVKIQLDDLGVEVSFSLDRLKSQMVEHILKAI